MSDKEIEAANQLLDKLRDWMKDAIEVASGYEQIIIAAGYAGFLTIWSQTAPHLPRQVVLISGGLISVSLVAFVGFHVLSVFVRSLAMLRTGKVLQKHHTPTEQLAAFQAIHEENARKSAIILIIWPFVFGVAVITGFVAASLVAGVSFWAVVYSSAE